MATDATKTQKAAETYILYHNHYSLCSLMVRFTLALCKEQGEREGSLRVEEHEVNIQNGGQLSEYYLCDVNPYGTVPVLANDSNLSEPIRESLDITYYLGEFYPNLSPPHLNEQIRDLLDDLHRINYFSLTYTHRPQRASDMMSQVTRLLAQEGISERYRKALEFKRGVVGKTRAPALDPAFVAKVEAHTTSFLSKLCKILEDSEWSRGIWLFGTEKPTALDAHVIPFLARLYDAGRQYMIDPQLQSYAETVFEMDLWKEFMGGRKTIYVSYI
ncbi:hypothetical protein F5884DRAFT_841009 [Xylogone sp. PMI_703]|nr:hypothetical protein F5884DRAFT_841009 [Xylogone sp. PMI_703]